MTHTETKFQIVCNPRVGRCLFQVKDSNSQILFRTVGARTREMINKRVNLSSDSSALEASLTHRTPQSSANWPFSTCQEMPGCSHMPGRAAASLIQTHRFWKPFSSAGKMWPAPG